MSLGVGRVASLLAAWRAADRRWAGMPQDDPGFRKAAIEVVEGWLAYHLATDELQPGEIVLVADDDRRYVAASDGVLETLGYESASLIGMRVDDLAPVEEAGATDARWRAFVLEGRQDGVFPMLARDGSVVPMQYQARAHFPIAGFHLSRLWPTEDRAPRLISGR